MRNWNPVVVFSIALAGLAVVACLVMIVSALRDSPSPPPADPSALAAPPARSAPVSGPSALVPTKEGPVLPGAGDPPPPGALPTAPAPATAQKPATPFEALIQQEQVKRDTYELLRQQARENPGDANTLTEEQIKTLEKNGAMIQ